MSTFTGFSTPNYVQVPHEFFDIILETDVEKSSKDRGISKGEIKLLAFMIRYTFGWQKAGFSLRFTFSDIQKHTNMQRQQVNDAIKKCLENEYIERAEIEGEMYYRLKMDDDDLSWETSFDWKKRAPKTEKEQQYDNHTNENKKSSRYDNHTEEKKKQYDNHTDTGVIIIPEEKGQALDTSSSNSSLKKRLKKNDLKKIDDDDFKESTIYKTAIKAGMTEAKAKQAYKALAGKEIAADILNDVFGRIVEEYGPTLRGVGAAQPYIKKAIDNQLAKQEKKIKQKRTGRPAKSNKQTKRKNDSSLPPLILKQMERQKEIERQKALEEKKAQESIEEKRKRVEARLIAMGEKKA